MMVLSQYGSTAKPFLPNSLTTSVPGSGLFGGVHTTGPRNRSIYSEFRVARHLRPSLTARASAFVTGTRLVGGRILVICELCGSANIDSDVECRVCGHPLPTTDANSDQVSASAPVTNSVFAPPPPADIATIPSHLQMSAFAQDVSTGAPPMFGSGSGTDVESLPAEAPAPSFMQNERRMPAPEPETTGLISASDLPQWIRQIAEQDAAKAEAETQAHAAAVQHEHPASLHRRYMPGETVGAGPTTNWLSKTASSAESSEHWSSAEVASANWGVFEPPVPVSTSTYATPVPPTAFVPAVGETPKTGKRLAFPARGEAKAPKPAKAEKVAKVQETGERRPFYKNRMVWIAFFFMIGAVLAVLLFG
jgi:hypothetical protein